MKFGSPASVIGQNHRKNNEFKHRGSLKRSGEKFVAVCSCGWNHSQENYYYEARDILEKHYEKTGSK